MEDTQLLIIDPQNDFCDPKGALYVQGAEDDMQRLADFINSPRGDKIKQISVTLDSHHYFDIGHPTFWVDSAGNPPPPMITQISHDDVKNQVWTTKKPSMMKHALDYTDKLEKNGRYPHMVWPIHCVIGTWGHCIHPTLEEALRQWASKHSAIINMVTKGSNPMTEHYSAVKADVPMPNDPMTNINTRFIKALESADTVLVAGEASSHCVLYTVRDIAEEFGKDSVSKICLMLDAMSPVQAPGIDFPQIAQDFIEEMKKNGARTTKTTEWMQSQTLSA